MILLWGDLGVEALPELQRQVDASAPPSQGQTNVHCIYVYGRAGARSATYVMRCAAWDILKTKRGITPNHCSRRINGLFYANGLSLVQRMFTVIDQWIFSGVFQWIFAFAISSVMCCSTKPTRARTRRQSPREAPGEGIYVSRYTCMYIYIYIERERHTYIHMYIWREICMLCYMYIYIYMSLSLSIYICMYCVLNPSEACDLRTCVYVFARLYRSLLE